jgi:farnesyl diphosphate synthase
MSVVDTVEILKRRPLTDEEYVKAGVLGWCVELVRGPYLTVDPIVPDRRVI